MKFVNRDGEMALLDQMVSSGNKEFLVLYGRRRLGKTRLLREFTRIHPALFFSCPVSTETEALRMFQLQMADAFSEPLLDQARFPSWHDALKYTFQKCTENKIALVFDEFPYLLRSAPGIDATLQHLWDVQEKPILLAISGSLLSIMQEHILGSKAPLYGRRTEQMELKALLLKGLCLPRTIAPTNVNMQPSSFLVLPDVLAML